MEPQLLIPLLPGDLVDRYRVDDFVAEGGMGQVFRAWDTGLERRVALKVIRADHASEQAALVRFQREAQILARLNHPGICQVYDWLDHHGTVVMAMEWVEGEPLSTVLGRGPLPVPQVIRLLREVAAALGAAHAKGVIHRDLKPSNILVTPEGSAKLLDFGLAKSLADLERELPLGGSSPSASDESPTQAFGADDTALTQPGMIVGTRGYLAPEVLLGEAGSAGSDLYALGVIAAMALTGEKRPPTRGRGTAWARRLLKPRSGSGAPTPGPRALWTLVEGLLATDPSARPSAQEVVHQLDRRLKPASMVRWVALTATLTLLFSGIGFWAYARGAIPEFTSHRRARLVVVPIVNLSSLRALDAEASLVTTDLLEHLLRSFPQVKVVQDRALKDGGAKVSTPSEPALQPFLAQVVARTGADLVLMGSLQEDLQRHRTVLQIQLRDPAGRLRAQQQAVSRDGSYEPQLQVPTVLLGLSRVVSPLGEAPAFPPLPGQEALDAYAQGSALLSVGDALRAQPLLEKAAELAPRFAPAVVEYGKALFTLGDAKTGPTFMWARSAAREAGDHFSEAKALIGLASLARRTDRNSDEEEQLLGQALELGKVTGDSDLQAEVLDRLGVRWNDQGQYERAKSVLNQAVELTTANRYYTLRASIQVNLANSEKGLHARGAAYDLYASSLKDAVYSGNRLAKGIALTNLAILDLEDGHLDKAERAFQGALAVRRALGDREYELRSLLLLGIVAYMKGDLNLAGERFRGTVQGARDIGSVLLQGRALYRLGDVMRTRGNLGQATALFMEASEKLRKKGTAMNQSENLAALAECKARLHELRGAQRLLAEARSLAGKETPQLLRATAWLRRLEGRHREAAEALAGALALPKEDDPEHQAELQRLQAAWSKAI